MNLKAAVGTAQQAEYAEREAVGKEEPFTIARANQIQVIAKPKHKLNNRRRGFRARLGING